MAKSGNRIRIGECYGSPDQFFAAHPERAGTVDVVLFDVDVDRQGPDFESLAKITGSGHRVVVYTELANDEVILTSLDLGAASYVIKSEACQYLIERSTPRIDNFPMSRRGWVGRCSTTSGWAGRD